jgi:hypothetical protein
LRAAAEYEAEAEQFDQARLAQIRGRDRHVLDESAQPGEVTPAIPGMALRDQTASRRLLNGSEAFSKRNTMASFANTECVRIAIRSYIGH